MEVGLGPGIHFWIAVDLNQVFRALASPVSNPAALTVSLHPLSSRKPLCYTDSQVFSQTMEQGPTGTLFHIPLPKQAG